MTPPSAQRRSCRRNGPLIAVVDTGPLYAAADLDDRAHGACVDALEDPELELVVPALVVAEAAYLVGTRLGPSSEAGFVKGLAAVDVEGPGPGDWERMAELIERYADLPLGATDASVIAIAERLDTACVLTLDRRHFSVVRPRHRDALELLPA